MDSTHQNAQLVVDEVRRRYLGLTAAVESAVHPADDTVNDAVYLASLGDRIDQSLAVVRRVSSAAKKIKISIKLTWPLLTEMAHLFETDEANTLIHNHVTLQHDIRLLHESALAATHHGLPQPVSILRTGRRGRPRLILDREFLTFATEHRDTTALSHFLGVSRPVVANALREYGLREAGEDPFVRSRLPSGEMHYQQIQHYTAPQSQWSDVELDAAIIELRVHYPNSGVSMLWGALRAMGQRVGRQRISESLLRVSPLDRLWQRTRIERRVYSVPGPNFLWHHDGQHGLIRWGIVIHGFIDGYSRLITCMKAHDNNRALTVLELFKTGIERYGVPSRVRGDHGVENLQVAALMEEIRGVGRGSYIWGRSIHNVRIERLWVDVTKQFGAKWSRFFSDLEVHHHLDINNTNHIWLLHLIFLPLVNDDISFFISNWNHHRLQARGQRTRSPLDMFNFDMMVRGVRGTSVAFGVNQEEGEIVREGDDQVEELDMYGVDWEALADSAVITSQRANNAAAEGVASWNGRLGPPTNLSSVVVDPPRTGNDWTVGEAIADELVPRIAHLLGNPLLRSSVWIEALNFVRARFNGF